MFNWTKTDFNARKGFFTTYKNRMWDNKGFWSRLAFVYSIIIYIAALYVGFMKISEFITNKSYNATLKICDVWTRAKRCLYPESETTEAESDEENVEATETTETAE